MAYRTPYRYRVRNFTPEQQAEADRQDREERLTVIEGLMTAVEALRPGLEFAVDSLVVTPETLRTLFGHAKGIWHFQVQLPGEDVNVYSSRYTVSFKRSMETGKLWLTSGYGEDFRYQSRKAKSGPTWDYPTIAAALLAKLDRRVWQHAQAKVQHTHSRIAEAQQDAVLQPIIGKAGITYGSVHLTNLTETDGRWFEVSLPALTVGEAGQVLTLVKTLIKARKAGNGS